jgi:glutamate-1-semialdehyde 2,1-aminomutase
MILGHGDPEVTQKVCEAAGKGASYGAPTEAEAELAEAIVRAVDSIEMVRLVNSGTEATMTALRLARGVTGREKFIKFRGCYHGHGDAFLVEAGSGAATLGVPGSPGVTSGTTRDTLLAEFNDLGSIETVFRQNPGQIAAVIVEPVAGNMGVIQPRPGFLEGLRELTRDGGALLIFDEVMTGFRVGPRSAQGLYDVRPDLTTLGKVIGGGLPVGAVGGRRDLMEHLAPSGPVYQAGTLSGNPLTTAAGIATLKQLNQEKYDLLESLSQKLERGVKDNLQDLSLSCQYQRVGSMSCLFFSENPVENYKDAQKCDTERFATYFQAMREQGFHLPPSQFEAMFISTAHTEDNIQKTIKANRKALERVKRRN